MSLLDWLTEGIGSSMGSSSQPMVNATNNYASPGSAPLGPDETGSPTASLMDRIKALQSSGAATPPPAPTPPLVRNSAPIDPSTTDIAGGMTGAGPAPPPVPIQQPRPGMPPAATPTSGTGIPPGPPVSLAPPAPNPDSSPTAPSVVTPGPQQTALGRALGITPAQAGNQGREIMGGIGAGLKSVGANWNKPGLAAFAGSAGAAMEGGQKASDTGYDQRLKSLQLAISAQSAGDKAAYNKNYADYLKGKLANDEASATPGGKKSSAWNKPDSQKFIDAQNALAKDPDIRASQKVLEKLVTSNATPQEIEQAQAAHTALVQQKQAMYLTGVGLNPAQIQANINNPPGTPQNPHVFTGNGKSIQQQFDAYVKPGQAYKNPADGKIYIRKNEGGDQSEDAQAPAASAPSAPAPPGPMPGTAAAPDLAEDD
ncbi:MAG TPA: hypothetical protein VII35_07665 [Steroidobacteraceae bacterium]